MAYSMPKDLDEFLPHLSNSDTKFRQRVGNDLLAYLAEPSNTMLCQDIGQLVDGIIPWMQSSNYKISSTGIEILTYLIDRLGTDFRPYLQTVLPNVVDRLGDSKDSVREKSQLLILKLLERNVLTPQTVLEKLSPAFSHKNAKIREEVLRCLVNTLNEHGAQSLTLSKFIPDIVNLLSDPTAPVRDTASNTLVELYKHVGEKLRIDLQKRNLVPQGKWPALSARFDEVKRSGELLPSASRFVDSTPDEVDRIMHKPAVPVKKPNLGSAIKQRTMSSTVSAGAVDEESFLNSFEDVPTVQIFSAREVQEHLKNFQDIISDPNKDWTKRVETLKKIRSLAVAGAKDYDEFYTGIRNLEIALQGTLKDLRSQVVREACVTISYLATIFKNKFDKSAEVMMQPLINLIQNSAKVMASAGLVTIRFLILNIHSPRLVPVIVGNAAASKSKDIRRACCEFIEIIVTNWPTGALEKHVAGLQEALKKGIADADPEARVSSRKAFRGFRDHFPDQAENLLQSLEPTYRKALQGDIISASTSNNNLASAYKGLRYGGSRGVQSASDSNGRKGLRSNSAIDLQAAQRAKARAQYAQMARNKIASGTASLQGEIAQQARPKKIDPNGVTASPERLGRARSRSSQSQPTSRSGSPSSRLPYLYGRPTERDTSRTRRLSSGIPRSTQGSRDTSREASPNRGSSIGRYRRSIDRPPLNPSSRPVLAQKILQQSREAENALADVLNDSSTEHFRSPRKSMRSIDNHSDESETSSVCSEYSLDSSKRLYDSYSWSGSQQRLASRECWEPCRDINKIITSLSNSNWQDRKDGLMSLQYYLSTEMQLTPGELKYLTEIFTRMFNDPHTKGLSLFLDTLHEVIKIHKQDLHFWIYVLLQRIFVKLGTEALNSVQSKLLSTLEIIRNNFPIPLLINNIYRFLVDATQTPNSKVKSIVMNYLAVLFNHVDGGELEASPNAQQALQKIIMFTQDTKSAEIRNSAKHCLVAMWNCSTSTITMMLAQLPKELQDIASNIVHSHMRKSSTGSEPGSPMVLGTPKMQSPCTSPLRDGLDQDEIYRSLKKTTAEIQNYSYEALGSKLERDRDTTSQDSGISQMSTGNDGTQTIEERLEELNLKGAKQGPRSLPFNNVNGVNEVDSNGFRSLGYINKKDVVSEVLEFCLVDVPTPVDEKRRIFARLIDLIKQGNVETITQNNNFKKILRVIIDNLVEKQDPLTKVSVLEILSAIFERKELKPFWSNFVELLTLKVLDGYCDEKREVVRAAEFTAASMSVFPFNTVVNTLAPLVRTRTFPSIYGTIKMLTKIIECTTEEITDAHLNNIMPGFITAADHDESPVRKAAIFGIVALHKAVGEERMAVYINRLPGSRIKLLRLYISRSKQETTK